MRRFFYIDTDKNALHNIIVEGRKKLSATGIKNVDSFDDETISAYTSSDKLIIKGKELHIEKINVDSGNLTVIGNINSVSYTDKDLKSKGSAFSKLFK